MTARRAAHTRMFIACSFLEMLSFSGGALEKADERPAVPACKGLAHSASASAHAGIVSYRQTGTSVRRNR
jgi:hypothetical protein